MPDSPSADGAGQNPDPAVSRISDQIPSPEECLARIAELPGAIALGFLKPAQANAMRAAYERLIAHHTKKPDASAGLADVDVINLCRRDPSLLNVLARFLTADQLRLVNDELRSRT